MKQNCIIALLLMTLLSTVLLADTDVYVDDSYYWFNENSTIEVTAPIYDKHAKELIFIEDTTTQQPDTIHMRILSI